MKKLALLLSLLLLIGCLAACSTKPASDPETTGAVASVSEAPDTEPAGTDEPSDLPAETTETPEETAQPLPSDRITMADFTVETIDGGTFTLSQALQDHELVLVNLWATWCGPCAYEFPFLQTAWEQNQDKVAVIALSVEPDDTLDVIRAYAEQRGLRFPMGRAEGTDLMETFSPGGMIPTSILVDRSGAVTAVEIGAKGSVEEFEALFADYLGDDYQTPSECTYTLICMDMDGEPVPGCAFSFCNDELCVPVQTDDDGTALFIGAPTDYHLQVVSLPEGWTVLKHYSQMEAGPYSSTLIVYLTQANP